MLTCFVFTDGRAIGPKASLPMTCTVMQADDNDGPTSSPTETVTEKTVSKPSKKNLLNFLAFQNACAASERTGDFPTCQTVYNAEIAENVT